MSMGSRVPRACLERLDTLVPAMERALAALDDGPLVPPQAARRWWFVGFLFTEEPTQSVGRFTLDEAGWDYLYVTYLVQLTDGQVTGAEARVE